MCYQEMRLEKQGEMMWGLPAFVGSLPWRLEKPLVLQKGSGVGYGVPGQSVAQMAVEGRFVGEGLVSVSSQAGRISVSTRPWCVS